MSISGICPVCRTSTKTFFKKTIDGKKEVIVDYYLCPKCKWRSDIALGGGIPLYEFNEREERRNSKRDRHRDTSSYWREEGKGSH